MATLTADTITDADIKALLRSLPTGHYARQWCVDAVSWSASHPDRRRNARRELAEILNARIEEPLTDDQLRAMRDEARAVGDQDTARMCSAALGLPVGDGANGTLDAAVCRQRAERFRTPYSHVVNARKEQP